MKPSAITINCPQCGGEFKIHKYRIKEGKQNFCSNVCRGRWIAINRGVWNKGLDPNDPRALAKAHKQAATLKSKFQSGALKQWNVGLTKETDPRVANYVAKQTEWRNTEGPEKDAWRKAMSVGQVRAHAAGKYRCSFTAVERRVWRWLKEQGFLVRRWKYRRPDDPPNTWYAQYPLEGTFVPDFACPDQKQLIECNGCAIHGHDPTKCKHRCVQYGWATVVDGNRKRDRQKFNFYQRKGWRCKVVWECQDNEGTMD